MKKFIVCLMVASITVVLVATNEASAGYGSCYEVQPICIGTHPVCMCNQNNYCFWACR